MIDEAPAQYAPRGARRESARARRSGTRVARAVECATRTVACRATHAMLLLLFTMPRADVDAAT